VCTVYEHWDQEREKVEWEWKTGERDERKEGGFNTWLVFSYNESDIK